MKLRIVMAALAVLALPLVFAQPASALVGPKYYLQCQLSSGTVQLEFQTHGDNVKRNAYIDWYRLHTSPTKFHIDHIDVIRVSRSADHVWTNYDITQVLGSYTQRNTVKDGQKVVLRPALPVTNTATDNLFDAHQGLIYLSFHDNLGKKKYCNSAKVRMFAGPQ